MNEKIETASTRVLDPGTVAVVGIPFDEYSSFMRGPAKAPSAHPADTAQWRIQPLCRKRDQS